MRVITLRRLREFWTVHSAARTLLKSWYKIVIDTEISNFEELKALFPQVDYVDGLYVFNIGNSYRLIAAIHFNRHFVYVRHVLTHAEYDRGKWKPK